MNLTDRAIKFESSNAKEDNVVTQKFKESINSPAFYDITFAGVGGVNIPNKIDGYKLKTKSFNYIYGLNDYVVEARCIYEEDFNYENEILDFSSLELNADYTSNYFLYYDLQEVSSSFDLPEWKVYTNQEKVNLTSILNELKNKGGYFVNFKDKKVEKFNINSNSGKIQEIDLNSSDVLNKPNINIKTKVENPNTEVYLIDDNFDNDNNEFKFLEKEKDLEEKTITEDPDNAINPPDDVEMIDDLSLNFDISGRTKTKKTITTIDDKPVKEITEIYGFAFTALDVSKKIEEEDPDEGETNIYYRLKETQPALYWKKIERRIKKYEFGDYNYVTRITQSGWKLGRYRKEQGVPFNTDKVSELPTIKWNPDGESEGNQYKKSVFEFQKFNIKELTQRKLVPHAYFYHNVEGRKLEDVYLFYKKYNEKNQEVETKWVRDKNWYEPMFVTQEYHLSSIYGETYDYYKLPNGDYNFKNNNVIYPDIFGEVKEYYKNISIFTNKQRVTPSDGNEDFKVNVIKPTEENRYKYINKTFQTGNSGFTDIAEKTEISKSSGLPPVGERVKKTKYVYDIKDTTEHPIEDIPDGFENKSKERIIVYPKDNKGELPSSNLIKPNDYNFAESKNIQQALQTNVGTIQTDKDFALGSAVQIDGFPEFFVLSKTKVVDTKDKVGGIFPDGSIRTHEYFEYELGLYKDYFKQITDQKSENDDNDDDKEKIRMPAIEKEGIGYTRSESRSKIQQLNYALRGNKENNEEHPVDDENED